MGNEVKIEQMHTVAKDMVWVRLEEDFTPSQVENLRYAFEHLHQKTGIHFVITTDGIELISLSNVELAKMGLTRIIEPTITYASDM